MYDAPDPASETLLWPFAAGALAWPAPGRTLMVGVRAGPALGAVRRHAPLFVQGFRPWAARLERDGFRVVDEHAAAAAAPFAAVLVRAPRQRVVARATLARALALAGEGGVVVACSGNQEGARALQADLQALAGELQVVPKSHCRVAWTRPGAIAHAPALAAGWAAGDLPRPVLDGRFLSRPGAFAWDRVDARQRAAGRCAAG